MWKFNYYIVFILVGLLTAAVRAEIEPSTPVDELCNVVDCFSNKWCRVVTGTSHRNRKPQAACISCVPEGVDEICNRNGYYYTVLIGQAGNPGLLRGKTCNATSTHKFTCPLGSVCIAEGNDLGSCCYGKPDPPPAPGMVITNGIPVCPDECGGCEPNFSCVKKKYGTYRCMQNKPGGCLLHHLMVPDNCPNIPDQCKNDYDCPGALKCCSSPCERYCGLDPTA